jgi:serine/threonine-protein kinase
MRPPLPTTTLAGGKYRIVSHIGSGGMAEVYRAVHRDLGIEIALKILAHAGGDAEQRFRREARAAVSLDHPGCVRVYDFGPCAGDAQYIAMELLHGPSLRGLLGRYGAVRADWAVWTMRHVLDALAHAHRRGLLHRDLKPENVMFGRRGDEHRPVLIDFGLAKLAEAAPLTAAGMCCGSPSYVAPERLLGRPYRASADVYAAGVVLYELCAGIRPFRGETLAEICRDALTGAPVPLGTLADVPPALEAVVHRALARDPARRFPDAAAMADALGAIADRRAA